MEVILKDYKNKEEASRVEEILSNNGYVLTNYSVAQEGIKLNFIKQTSDDVLEIGENKYKKLTNSIVWYDKNTKAIIIISDCEFSKNHIQQIETTFNNGQILYVPKQTYGVLIDNKIHDGTKVIFDFKEDNSVKISDGKSKLTISGKEISYEDIDNTYKQVKEAMDFTLREIEKGFKKAQTVRDKYINTLKYADNIIKEIQQMNKELSDDIHSI